jgi:uncharacterized protein
MLSTLDGYPLEMFAYETAAKNKLGSAKNNNGVLFLVVKNDKLMRIEVGYGLEGAIPDALASSILRNEVRPHFKRGDYFSGISAGINAIVAASAGEYTRDKSEKVEDGDVSFPFVYIIIFIIIMILSRGGKKGGGSGILPLLILSSMGGGRSRGGWGGGSGFGGGFGGFSGGGGSFGGGGASGSW